MNDSDLIIRPGIATDLPEILQLVMELAVYEKAENEVITDIGTYQAHFNDNWFKTLVAKKNNTLVGMMLFYNAFSTWKGKMLWLEDFVVSESYRNQGIGLKLFEELVEFAKREKYQLIKWEVLDWNTPAVNFYKKIGAQIETNWWDGKYFLNP